MNIPDLSTLLPSYDLVLANTSIRKTHEQVSPYLYSELHSAVYWSVHMATDGMVAWPIKMALYRICDYRGGERDAN
jgi:hypothetical protein